MTDSMFGSYPGRNACPGTWVRHREFARAIEAVYGLGVDFSPRMIEVAKRNHRDLEFVVGDVEDASFISELEGPFDYIVLSDTIGYLDDIGLYFVRCARFCTPYAPYGLFSTLIFGTGFGACGRAWAQMPQPGVNFLSSSDITNLLYLAGFEVVRTEWRQLIPKRLLGIGTLLNRYLGTLPLIRRLCLRHYIVARPFARRHDWTPSVSVLILVGMKRATLRRRSRECRDSPKIWRFSMSKVTRAMGRSRNASGFGMPMQVNGTFALRNRTAKGKATRCGKD